MHWSTIWLARVQFPDRFFCIFLSLVLMRKLVSMHKQSLPREDECTQASHFHLTLCWVGVIGEQRRLLKGRNLSHNLPMIMVTEHEVGQFRPLEPCNGEKMCIDLVKGRTWLQSLNTTAKCGTILLCHISPFRVSHLPNPPPPPYGPREDFFEIRLRQSGTTVLLSQNPPPPRLLG